MPLVSETEHFSNLELSKITAWSTRNKITFNVEKSKVMLISSRKRKEVKEIKIYLNKQTLGTSKHDEISRNNYR